MTLRPGDARLAGDVTALLAGPRGRRLGLEYAATIDPEIQQLMFWLAYRAAPENSTLLRFDDGTDDPDDPDVTVADLVALIAANSFDESDDSVARTALRAAVDAAMYWQSPDGADLVAALPAVRTSLIPIAEALLSSPVGAAWQSARTSEQWAVDWRAAEDAAPLPSNVGTLVAAGDQSEREEEARAARERPRDPEARWSGSWWSVPASTLSTREHVADALELIEDDFGPEVATVIPVRGTGRVLEITSARDWAELCRAFPLEVTASRRHDWYRVTGRDGRWLIPAWSRVALEWDAVHLTTFGYLSAATSLIKIDEEYASVIGGWGPDATYWLNDTARESSEPRQHWARPSASGEWTRES